MNDIVIEFSISNVAFSSGVMSYIRGVPKKNDHFFNVVFPIVEKIFNVILKTAKNTTSPKTFFTCFVKKVEKRLKYGGNDFFPKTK